MQTPGDAHVGGDAGGDSMSDASADASSDASPDAPPGGSIGPLTPDPPDPTSLPCAGVLGFPGPGMIPTPPNPGEMVVGDVDGDGHPDILYSGPQVGVARGNGNGTFQTPTVWMPPSTSTGFRIVQFDAGGKPDVLYITSSASSAEIRVALDYGTNGFTVTQTLYSSATIRFDQVELIDVNGDGKKDLVGLNESSYQVGVLLATATGFDAPQLYSAGVPHAWQMAVGDLTGDGRPDLVVTNDANVNVLVNNGNGTFANRIAYPTPAGAWGVVLADANEDGMLDVIVGARTANVGQISVLLNQGGGVLGVASNFPFAFASDTPRVLAAADVNGDGHIDVAGADWPGAGVNLLFGTGTGQFGTALPYLFESATSVAFADLQADGHVDMVVLARTGAKVYLNRGTSSPFEERAWFEFGSPHLGDAALRMTDLDNDGRLDLLAAGQNSSSNAVIATRLATGSGMFGPAMSYPVGLISWRATLTDLDNNGRADLVLLGYGASGGRMQAVINNGDGTVSPRTPLLFPETRTELAIADVNGDGIRDAVLGAVAETATYPSSVRYFPGLGNGIFGPATQVWTGTYLHGLAVGDLNNDGNSDLAIASFNNDYRQEVILGTGNGGFATPIVTTATNGPLSHLFMRDLDNDGHLDVIGVEREAIVVMRGSGTGALAAPVRIPASSSATDAAFGDLDGDGHLDIVTGGDGFVCVLLGRGDGTFNPPRYFEAGATITQVSIGDVDGDGRLDLLVNGGGIFGDAAASVLYGRCL